MYPSSDHRGKRDKPDVGIAVVPVFQAFQVFLRLIVGTRKVDRGNPVTAEVEGSIVGSEMWFVVGTVAERLLIVAKVPNLLHLPPAISFAAHDEQMIFGISFQASGATKNQE